MKTSLSSSMSKKPSSLGLRLRLSLKPFRPGTPPVPVETRGSFVGLVLVPGGFIESWAR